MVLQPVVPPSDCDVLILHDGSKAPVKIIVGDTGNPENITYTMFNSTGIQIGSGNLSVGSNEIQVAHLQAGTYYIQIRADVEVNGKRKPQILKDAQGRNAWCIAVSE
jgi:hypothetical protein